MGIGTYILFGALHAGSLALLIYWSAGLARLLRAIALPTARAGLALAGRAPPRGRVAIVVPAHNEEESIAALVGSLRAQDHAPLHVVLCLDRCTDRTEAVAREAAGADPRFQIAVVRECPPGWAGKVHAIWRGLNEARHAANADYLLFADADTVFHPACVRATLALLEGRELDVLSLLSTLTHDRWFERLVQPATAMELLTQYPLHRANLRVGRRAFLNGQFMLFRRDAYESIGGHAAVRDELLEDMALARLGADRGLRTGVLVAAGLLTCRMYRSWPEFRRGWARIFTEAAKRKPRRLERAAWRVRTFGALLPVAAAADVALWAALRPEGPWWIQAGLVAPVMGLATVAAVVLGAYRRQRAPLWAAPAYIAGGWMTASILSRAAADLRRGRPTRWGGREYPRPAR